MPHHRTIVHPALQPLKEKFADVKFLVGELGDMVTIVVPRQNIVAALHLPPRRASLRYDMLAELNGVDYLNCPAAEHRFAVNYGLTSIPHNNRLWLKVFFDPTLPTVPKTAPRDEDLMEKGDPGLKVASVIGVWPGANGWNAEVVYDMFGIIFVGHPDLRRILTWNGFGSYPLRKDYPLSRRGRARGLQDREGEGA